MLSQAPPPPPARVAFVHAGAVWTMDASGNDRRRVVRGFSPAWSPDGSHLAFARRRQILTVAADSSDARVVVRVAHGFAGSPAWSPDGTRLAFSTGYRTVSRIATVGADGAGRRTVLRLKDRSLWKSVGVPTWSPDGQTLLYTRFTFDHVPEVRAVRIDGTQDRRLLARATSAVLSPDGTRLLFGTFTGTDGESCGDDACLPNPDIAVANADGTGRRTLLRTVTDESDPAWSPDGTRITFSSGRNLPDAEEEASKEVYSMAADGSCLTWLTNGNRESYSPRFSPGEAAPASCATDRPPLIELRDHRGPPDNVWLGETFGNGLLTYASRRDYSYSDCGAFEPSACPPHFNLFNRDSCRNTRDLRYDVRNLRAARVVGGSVAGHQLGDPQPAGFAGRRDLYVQVVAGRRRGLTDAIFASLSRVDGKPLGPPRLPERLIGRLPEQVREAAEPC